MTSGGKLSESTAVQVGMLFATAREAEPPWVSCMSFRGSARVEAVLKWFLFAEDPSPGIDCTINAGTKHRVFEVSCGA